MDLDLTDTQRLFHETTVRFIESEMPLTQVRVLHDDPVGYDRGWLRKAAELGWFATLVPEEYGGGSVSGMGLVDATIVAEELGRHVQPGPFLPMNVVAHAVATHGSDGQRRDVLPGLAAGELVATWAVADADGNWDGGRGVSATPSSELTGVRGFVQDAQSADYFLVATDRGQFLVPADASGIRVTPLTCLDLSRRMAEVTFDQAPGAPVGPVGAEEELLDVALVLLCAETVGAIDAMLSMTVEYAKQRIAFGRPIGSFQALKHTMADISLSLETCRAAAVAAADAVQQGKADARAMVAMAAAYIGDIATDVSQESLQIHGGIGYTWEHDLHLYLRRARSNSALFGEPSWHRERVCVLNGL